MQLPPGGGMPPGMRPPFPGPPSQGGVRPPFPGPGMPLPPGAPLPQGGPSSMPGMPMPAPGAGFPPGVPPPPGAMPGAPRPMGAPIGLPGAPVADQFQRMNLGGPGQMPPPGPPGMHPPPGMPPGPPGARPPFPGALPPGVPPPVPSSGTPINMPGVPLAPPSATSGNLVGIPPAGPNYQLSGGMGVPPPMANGFAGPPGMPRPPGPGFGAPPGPPGMGPPPPGHPGAGPPPPGMSGMPPPPGMPGMPPPGPQMGGPPGMPPPPGPPGMGPPGTPQAPQRQQMQNRIDPSQIPRPVQKPNTEPIIFETRVAGAHAIPPSAVSNFIVRDRGSCSPRYMRATLNHLPWQADLLQGTNMPMAVVVSPMALPDPQDDPIPLVNLGEMGPVRCARCKAYMNPFMRFTSNGRSFTCNFCGHSNTTPEPYFCHLGPDGRRRDADERPELCRGSVEYVATQDYMVRPPMPPAHIFVVDVTQAAVATGAAATVCDCISRVLEDLGQNERALVGLATFDSTLHFYSVRQGASQAQMLVVSDVNDVYAPDSAPLLLKASEHKEALQALLKQIPEMFAATRITDSCGGAALAAGVEVLKHTGGKLHAYIAALPSIGVHALKSREGGAVTDKDKLAMLTGQDAALKALANAAADFQVCIDVSLVGQGHLDVASWADVVTNTGGTLYQYTPFHPVMDHDQVLNDLRWNCVRPQALEAVMRVRCSQGLELEGYSGAFFKQPNNPTDLYLPSVDSDKAVIARLQHVDKLLLGSEAYLQSALLYTTTDGQRRIRIHTLALPATDNISTCFKGADLDAQIICIGRRVAQALPGGTLAAQREYVTKAAVDILFAYRKFCAASSSAVQLILPEALKLLPLYCLAMLKGHGLQDNMRPDDRSMWISKMMSLPCSRVTPLLYPRLLPVHRILEADEIRDLPEGLVLSAESLEAGGVYLLENGHDAVLHLDKAVAPQVLQDLLGASSHEELLRVPGALPLLPRENRMSSMLQELLQKVRIQRSSFLRLRTSRRADPVEVMFFNLLVEDRSTAGMSYVEYLCQVHRLIQNKVA